MIFWSFCLSAHAAPLATAADGTLQVRTSLNRNRRMWRTSSKARRSAVSPCTCIVQPLQAKTSHHQEIRWFSSMCSSRGTTRVTHICWSMTDLWTSIKSNYSKLTTGDVWHQLVVFPLLLLVDSTPTTSQWSMLLIKSICDTLKHFVLTSYCCFSICCSSICWGSNLT